MAEKKEESHLPETKDNDEKTDKGTNDADEKKNDAKPGEDDELINLLESALEDFALNDKTDDKSDPKEPGKKPKPIPPNFSWDDLFLEEAAGNFESDPLAACTPITDEQLGQLILTMELMTGTERMTGAEASPDVEMPNLFPQAMKQFYESPQSAEFQKQPKLSEEDSNKLTEKFNKYFESPQFKKLFPFIISMMQDLLSKEVLYGDFKGVIEKFSKWLEDNKAKLPSHEYDRYLKKLEILQEVCSELEKESPDDTEEVRLERCDRIMVLMIKIQDFGPMPSEIAGDMGPLFGRGGQENTEYPDFSPDDCNII